MSNICGVGSTKIVDLSDTPSLKVFKLSGRHILKYIFVAQRKLFTLSLSNTASFKGSFLINLLHLHYIF